MRSQSTKQLNCPKRGKNVGDQVVIGFSLHLIGWQVSGPITKQSKAKPM